MEQQQQNNQNKSLERSTLFVSTMASFIGPFMISSINVALPTIEAELRMDAVELSWIASSYLLAMAIGLVPTGKIGDMYGRKKLFLFGLIVYTLASTAAAFTASVEQLIFFRSIQGLGASCFTTTAMAILISVFPPKRRGRVLGIFVAAVYVGLSVGPFAGGILIQHFGWRSIFLCMLPLGTGCIIVTLLFLKGEWISASNETFDIKGSLTYGVSIFLLMYGISTLPSLVAAVLMPVGAAGLILFFYQQKNTKNPVFEVRLFSNNRTFTFSSLAALLNYSSTFAVTFMISLYLQYIKAMSPQEAGLVLMAQPVMMALFSPIAGRLSDRVEPRLLASTGMGIVVLGMLIFTQLHETTSTTAIVFTLMLLGFGYALFSSPNVSAIMGSVPKPYYGLASGMVATMRLMGQMVSIAICTMALALIVGRDTISPQYYGHFLASVHVVFATAGILCTVGICFSIYRGQLREESDALEG